MIIALLAMLLMGGTTFASPSQVQFYVSFDSSFPGIPDLGKSPVTVPEVWLDDHEVTFQSGHPQYTLIIEQEGQVVWSTVVTTSMTSVMLPAWLTGDATLLLIPDDSIYYYYGDIII